LRAVEHNLYLKAHFNNIDVHLYGEVASKREELYLMYTSSNVFMEVLASLGIYGLCAFVMLGVVVWQMFTSSIQDKRLPIHERKMILCFFLSIIVMMVCLQFNQEIFRNYVWAHMGISLGYLLSVRSEFLPV
jgi:O-antigen ligase